MVYNMERCGARRSFEKPRVEGPPRLQVIGFNVSPQPMKAADAAPAMSRGSLDMVTSAAANSCNELPISPSQQLSKPAASSPRSALQQLLLHQSLPCTSPPSFNQSLPPLEPSPNQNFRLGLLQPDISSPAAANQNRPSGGVLQPSIYPALANQKSTNGISKPHSPPSANQSSSSSGRHKSVVQSDLTTSDIPTNQCSGSTFFSQSQYANSSVSSGGSHMINQRNAKPAKAVIKEKYEAFFQTKQTDDDKNGAKSKKSSWLQNDGNDDDDHHDYDSYYEDDHPSAAGISCKKSSLKGVNPITQHSPSNEKSRKSSRSEDQKSKKSSVFIMFVSSSPAPDYHYQGQSTEHNVSTTMNFLSSCHLCRRSLAGHAQDIFMYSGDKAFCSMECRYQQIVIDERKERCPPSIIRSGASTEFHHTSVTAKSATHHPVMINKPYFINTAAAA